ncbi:MAG: response regulator [Deltaproteobacteria bacterium]|nr:response regulator [Deltaproteobacteria bacterium]
MQNSTLEPPRAHILLVERNRGALALLETMLCWKGYRVTTAVDGLDGLEKFRHGQFNLILTNLSTPRISGWELGRIVKNSDTAIPVALITGLDFGTRPDHSPFDAIFAEPFPFDEFECTVSSLIECRNGGAAKPNSLEKLPLEEGRL